jgi:hypothetical protein
LAEIAGEKWFSLCHSWAGSIDWSVIGEKKNGEKPGGEPAYSEYYCTKLKCVCRQFITKEILVEAAGVEPFISI